MSKAFKRLQRVLKLEADQGYQNKAVVGGIRQFAAFWVGQARDEAIDEADKVLIEQVAEVLVDYGKLSGVEARANAIDSLMSRLNVRAERLPAPEKTADSSPARPKKSEKTAVKKARPPKAESKPEPEEVAVPDPEALQQPVTVIKGVGPKNAETLARLGAETIWDLLYIFPRRYDDYTLLKPINRLEYGETVTIIGTIWEVRARQARNHKLVQAVISDGTAKIQATWFNQPWLTGKLKTGMQIVLSGTVDQYLGRPIFQNPDWEPVEMEPLKTRRIVPIYPLTSGLSSHKMREIQKQVANEWANKVPDPMPVSIRQRRGFYTLPYALRQTHFPDSQEALHSARQRIVFDELFLLQLGMLGLRRDWQSAPGLPVAYNEQALTEFAATLPFEMTDAQKRVVDEILKDMALDVPMNRLLQGDVGAGKTVIAAAAMVAAVRGGLQAALMAPTEILAEQHYQGLSSLLEKLGIRVSLLTGSTTAAQRTPLFEELADGTAEVVIGTQALIQEKVVFKNLGLVVIDEQHRFGVEQRKALRDKGAVTESAVSANGDGQSEPNPHLLVMSATPIPRSLALSLYGDLDLSVLDEMPPGRQEIRTRWLRPSERERAYSFVRSQIESGRQAFIICPLVEESDKIDAKSAVAEHERLQKEIFPDLKLDLLHGRMKSSEKEEVMRRFYAAETDILVSTSVIEVGIDVPNSTIMVIEGANRFGLAQLHQFRGRVGRGEHQSYCLLLAESVSGDAEQRLEALEKTNDGFMLAEKDLEIRGPGQFFGQRQSGLPELQLASLLDMKMLEMAREEAQALFELDPMLERPEHALLHEQVAQFWEQAADIS